MSHPTIPIPLSLCMGMNKGGVGYLCGTDDWFSCSVAFGDHHLLGKEDFFRRDLDTQISSSHHDTIGNFQNLIKSTNQNN